VDVRRHTDVEPFLAEAGPFLVSEEACNNLILGLAGTIRGTPDRYVQKRFWVVSEAGHVVAVAMQTPPYNLVLGRSTDNRALEALVDEIEDELPGATGVRPEIDTFVTLWAATHDVEPRAIRNMGVYALERVQPVPSVPGAARPATAHDRALLLEWIDAFGEEVLDENDPGRLEARNQVEHRLSGRDGGFLLWEDDGCVVSLSGWGGTTPNGIRVGPVYTPPELRGRGYATSLVAEVSQTLLDGGRTFVFLYTDLANPTSNAIYERIGYVKVAESAMVGFDRGSRK
jgi:predicted GNAT family acetyltransferase